MTFWNKEYFASYGSTYGGPDSVKSIYINSHYKPELIGNSVLVNPNFRCKIHVNPNFAARKANVFVNPNFVEVREQVPFAKPPESIQNNITAVPNVLINQNEKGMKRVCVQHLNNESVLTHSSKHKLVRSNGESSKVAKTYSPSKVKVTKYKLIAKHITIPNKRYKYIVLDNKVNKSESLNYSKPKIDAKSSYKVVTKYKILNKVPKKSKYKIIHKNYTVNNRKLQSQKGSANCNKKRTALISRYKIINKGTINPKVRLNKSKLQNKYKLSNIYYNNLANRNYDTVVLKTKYKFQKVDKRNVKSSNYSSTKKYKWTKIGTPKKLSTRNPNLVKINKLHNQSNINMNSITKLASPKSVQRAKMRINYIPCDTYKRTGKCAGLKSGICFKNHNPNLVNLCTKFLQGACLKDKCLLSHKVSVHKVPTCKYFLEGSCHRERCPYLHVKISPKADICTDFLRGYCDRGMECDQRHQYLCPQFEKNGSCPKKICRLPHGDVVRQYTSKMLNTIVRVRNDGKKLKSTSLHKNEKFSSNQILRYYVDEQSESSDSNGLKSAVKDSDTLEHTNSFVNRPKLGELPSFIPFS